MAAEEGRVSERPREMRRLRMPVGEERRVERRLCVALDARLMEEGGVVFGL